MSLLSLLKSFVLTGADALNKVVGGPQPFTRTTVPDPTSVFPDDMTRRDAIAAAAELELASFVREGIFVAQKPNDLGDACIWQGVYTAMTAMRWNAKPTAENQAAMLAATAALVNYFYPTGAGESILTRGAMPVSFEGGMFHIDLNNKTRYFMDGHLGPMYVFREDASLDSLLGAMFGAAIVKRFGDDASRAVLTVPLTRFAKAFAKAGSKITNRNGSPTTYGDCAPGVFQAPVRILAGVLPSLLAGTADWQTVARTYGPEFSTTDTQVPGKISWVNAHLAILANLAFVCAAPAGSPGLESARGGLRTLLDKYADAGNSFLVCACAALGVRPTVSQADKAAKILSEFPLGPKPKAGLNASLAPALQPVIVWQRPPADNFWQRSPYPYSGSESSDYNRMDYLVAHYLDRAAVKELR